MNLLKDIPPGTEKEVNLIIEIPKGCRNKYEYDKENKIFALDRVLYSPFHYPADYGFIPGTHCEDGDPLDGFLLINEKTFPGILAKSRIIGMIEMIDGGEQDNKLICVSIDDPTYKDVKDISDIPKHFPKEVKHFLEHYKDLQGEKVEITAIKGAKEAKEEFNKSVKSFNKL